MFVTPSLLFEMIRLFIIIIIKKYEELEERIEKYKKDIDRLNETKKSVASMKVELQELEPCLQEQREKIV